MEPELSGREILTAGKLKEFLLNTNPERLITDLGGHGLLAVYCGREPGPEVLLRCEMDAVPVQENLDLPYCSLNPGVSHKCGHDGHMAVLAGVASKLHTFPTERGKVLLLFQPGEETGTGAKGVMNHRKFDEFHPDMVFAMHNLPGFPLGTVITSPGPFAGASRGLVTRLTGRSSHAAEPLKGISPAPVVAQLIEGFEELCNHDQGVLVTLIHSVIGEPAFGTSPEKAVVMATLRAPDGEQMDILSSRTVELAERTSAAAGLVIHTEWTEEFPATVNSEMGDRIVRTSAKKLGMNVYSPEKPFPWSEDFGYFTEAFGGAIFGLGAGRAAPPLHNPSYNFPDELIETGISLYTGIIETVMKQS